MPKPQHQHEKDTQAMRSMIDTARGWHQVSEVWAPHGPVKIEFGPGDPSVQLVAMVPRRLNARETLDALIYLELTYNRLKKVVAGHEKYGVHVVPHARRAINQKTTIAQEVNDHGSKQR